MQTYRTSSGSRLPRYMAADAASFIKTHLARLDETVAQSLARALQAGFCRRKGQPCRLGEGGLGLTLQVTGAKNGGVLGRQLGKRADGPVRRSLDPAAGP